jgi:hypothetical protein
MGVQETDPHVIEGLMLMRDFLKITVAADRRKILELAARLARASSPPLAPRRNHLNPGGLVLLLRRRGSCRRA